MNPRTAVAASSVRRCSSKAAGLVRLRRATPIVLAVGVGFLELCVAVQGAPQRNHITFDRKNGGAVTEPLPANARSLDVVMLDDATKTRGGVASGGVGEAVVFDQPNVSGFGWFMKSDDVFGYGTWATQQILANSFAPGDQVSAYETSFIHGSDEGGSVEFASVMTELWDGDPMSIMETVCTGAGVSAPIPGTQAIFTNLPSGSLFRLRAELPEKVTLNCDRVWTVMTLLQGCRATWAISGTDGGAWNVPPTVGASNGVWLVWACEQFGACDTPSGYNAGTCCNAPEKACDHTDGDFSDCDVDGTAPTGLPTFCGDGAADYFVALIDEPDMFRSLVSTVYAPAEIIVQLIPVSVDAPPGGGDLPEGVISLSGNDLVLRDGDHNVWLEFRIGDWNPDNLEGDAGLLGAFLTGLDSSGYKTGDQGELTVFTGGPVGTNCTGDDHAPCVAALGAGALCDPPGYFLQPGTCSFAFQDQSRKDAVWQTGKAPITVVDLHSPNVRVAATFIVEGGNDPEPFPPGGLYAGTLVLHVPADARGTFTLDLLPFPQTQLVNDLSQFIPLVGVRPAAITVQTGRCCFNIEIEEGSTCVDSTITASECSQMPGVTSFLPGATCSDAEIVCPNQPGRCCFDLDSPGGSGCLDTTIGSLGCDQMPEPNEFVVNALCSDSDTCVNPGGRCCLVDGCDDDEMVGNLCVHIPGSEGFEPFATCSDTPPCLGATGSCCHSDGCDDFDMTAERCAQLPGVTLFDLHASCSDEDACAALLGRCCFNVGSAEGTDCEEQITAERCATMPGSTHFELGATCADANPCYDCGAIAAPAEPALETHAFAGNSRYLSLVAPEPGVLTALQVTLVDSELFPETAGMTWWVGAPDVYCENGAQINPPCSTVSGIPSSTFISSILQCEPQCMDFGSIGEVLHIGDPNIVPQALYEVRAFSCVDDTFDRDVCSEPLSIATSRYTDVVLSCAECPCEPAEGIINIIDCKAIADRFVSAPCAPLTARVDMVPAMPDRQLNVTDFLACLNVGFLGLDYSLSKPERCEP